MIFTDGLFFIFFTVAFTVYWLVGSNIWRKIWLLACSMVFYAAWDWRFLGLIFLVIINTYVVTLLIAATKEIGAAEGIFCAPEGAACLPALRKLLAAGEVEKDERIVLFNTGAGVKYPDTVPVDDLEVLPIGAALPR